MKKLVVYQSSTGFTKQYAQWIAEDLQCEAKDVKNVNQSEIAKVDVVIFGGWIMGGMISGLDKVRNMKPNKLVAFAVGSGPEELTDLENIKQVNHLDNEPIFYMTGGFRFKQLNFMKKLILKMIKKSVVKKENKTPQDQFMAEALGTSFDHSDRAFINPLVDYVKTLS